MCLLELLRFNFYEFVYCPSSDSKQVTIGPAPPGAPTVLVVAVKTTQIPGRASLSSLFGGILPSTGRM